MWDTQVQPLGQEDPLEKEMATLSIILAWKIWWTEETGRLQSLGSQEIGHNLVSSLSWDSLSEETNVSDGKISIPQVYK